jgi:DNA-binding NarL/FixJ family response regulator
MLVEDHAMVRAALTALVAAQADMEVCAESGIAAGLEDLAAAAEPDVVIVSLQLSNPTGIAASRRIRNRLPSTQVVLLTAASDRDALYASILAGAAAYLPKQLRGTDVVGTIRAVSGGARLLAAVDIELAVQGRDEKRLLWLLAAGRTDKELQRILGVDGAALQTRLDCLVAMLGSSRAGARLMVSATTAPDGADARIDRFASA